ncbi:fibrohexamerin-like [Anticarsia gemmatalis]|uniref:fibrohexamerin-like n=1 Tax=Anticarsia gemmatalis TaxID=129554 RepID=UPI003F776480
MKIFLCFVFLITFCDCLEDIQASENYWTGHDIPFYKGHDHHHSREDGRPCSPHDLDCIRSFFAHNFGCSAPHRSAPDPYLVHNLPLQLPHCNITLTLVDAQVKGINTGKIKEFFIDKEADALVLEVEFASIVVYTPHTVATYYRKGKAPKSSASDSIIDFKDLSLTLTIEHYRDQHRSKKHVYAYFNDAYPPFRIGPGITETEDPIRIRMNKKWMGHMALSAREAFLSQGPVYMGAYMQSYICDLRHI